MPYSELMVAPMREELTRLGIRELRTPEAVDAFMAETREGTALLVVNSICGCAAGNMRPAVALALETAAAPDAMASVFAGQDVAATERARSYITEYPPSSPSIALFKGGEVVFMLERHQIQGRSPQEIAADLIRALDVHHAGAPAER
ncbi:MAG TPA: BrxA/BrxB family bacilliredoxin [Longimicrobiales bacterium]